MEREVILARLGPDPLRADADPERAWARISRSKMAIGALLMSQDVLSGIGNVYRAEVLFRHRISPFRAGRVHRPRRMGRHLGRPVRVAAQPGCGRAGSSPPGRRTGPPRAGPLREDSFYVYRRTGEPCRICGTEIRTEVDGRPGTCSGARSANRADPRRPHRWNHGGAEQRNSS